MEWVSTVGYEDIFAEVLIEGDMGLYHHWKHKNLAYAMRKKDGEFTQLQNVEVNMRRKSQQGEFANVGNKVEAFIPIYRDTLRAVFSDQEEVAAAVSRVEYRAGPIMGITRDYLEADCEEGDCITFMKDRRLTRDRFGIIGGAQLSHLFHEYDYVGTDPTFSFPVGLFYHIPLSYFNDRLGLQFEILYRKVRYEPVENLSNYETFNYIETHTLGIPLLLQYRLSVNPFSPVIGFGKEMGFNLTSDAEYQYFDFNLGEIREDPHHIHTINKGGWFLDAGMEYDVNPALSVFAKVRLQRFRNKLIRDGAENNVTYGVAEGEQVYTNAVMILVGLSF
jgi:hypothetical protein